MRYILIAALLFLATACTERQMNALAVTAANAPPYQPVPPLSSRTAITCQRFGNIVMCD